MIPFFLCFFGWILIVEAFDWTKNMNRSDKIVFRACVLAFVALCWIEYLGLS